MKTALVLAITLLSSTALAKPPTVEERVAAQHARAEARQEREHAARAEHQRVYQAKRSARDLGLEGNARRRYVNLHR